MGRSPPLPTPPGGNEQMLDRQALYGALAHLASLLLRFFGAHQVTLYVHGGAVMVLHPMLNGRPTTRDVDVCLREFDQEWALKGIPDAEAKLRYCIQETARARRLAEDWMHSGPDVALPWAKRCDFRFFPLQLRDAEAHLLHRQDGSKYDPIVHAAKNAGNIRENIIYESSPLRLIAVSW